MGDDTYLIALNCGSSSIKGKLYIVPHTKKEKFAMQATLSVSNIGAPGEQIHFKLKWSNGKGKDMDIRTDDGGTVEHKDLFPRILDHLAGSGGVKKEQIKYVTHRIVHGGMNKKPLVVTKKHPEALKDMDRLGEFAPLHNYHAILGVRACIDVLPESQNLLCFDTLFHQTLSPAVYKYTLPPTDVDTIIPLRKYGFHGLSYASITHTLEKEAGHPVNLVVCHLGSGCSACCIHESKSIDTSMGLTPLEGLVGGTRTGSIDPTAIFHHTPDYAEPVPKLHVNKAEYVLNKKSGLLGLSGTTNFGHICERRHASVGEVLGKTEKSEGYKVTKEDKDNAIVTYDVFVDRLMAYLSQYVLKLAYEAGGVEKIDGIVFAGGIGENSVELRQEAIKRLGVLGVKIHEEKNKKGVPEGKTQVLVSSQESSVKVYIVLTDEEGWTAHMARDVFDI